MAKIVKRGELSGGYEWQSVDVEVPKERYIGKKYKCGECGCIFRVTKEDMSNVREGPESYGEYGTTYGKQYYLPCPDNCGSGIVLGTGEETKIVKRKKQPKPKSFFKNLLGLD